MRNESNKCIFKIQSKIQSLFRRFLEEKGFISISTPKLVSNGAEGGTNVFKLDYFGKEACLAQSPQFYKQMMCGVFGKVFETAPVFRAEKHNTSRHLNEYLSMDVEMVIRENMSEIISLQAEMMTYILSGLCGECGEELIYLGVKELPSEKLNGILSLRSPLTPVNALETPATLTNCNPEKYFRTPLSCPSDITGAVKGI